MLYPKHTDYILGVARIGKNDPISSLFDVFFIGIVVDRQDGVILDATCNMVKDMTTSFIRSILIGYNLTMEMDAIENEIKDRFHGMAQRAVIASVKDARNKWQMINEERN